MICEKCGKEYLTRECLRCRDKENNPPKKRNISLIIITISIAIIALIMIKNEYVKYRQEQEMMKLLFGTDDPDEVEKRINKIQKDNNEMIRNAEEKLRKTEREIRKLYPRNQKDN